MDFYTKAIKMIPKVFQVILNVSLILLAIILSFLLIKELIMFVEVLLSYDSGNKDYRLFLEHILIFFLYFEFIAMIVKYFKEDYHFPMRYFLYIGITAMVRLIIVDHYNPMNTLLYALVILILIIGYFIMNITPRNRPDGKLFFRGKGNQES
ncbi:phosphate-starvation-inducible protein PsiE [Bacillus pinisoli]|uniref:phosphate-starvation-inducible protein PsiE n=1 Tax=Bacillus pinisoli TaxID=2901866 RepID=UPI001FF50198|nr:phosphate-starvation-inducible protein PsiE [Bacillus pinisoli]